MNAGKIRCNIIEEVFKTMEYSEKKRGEVPQATGDSIAKVSTEELHKILAKLNEAIGWGVLKTNDRAILLNKLASELENLKESFVNFEELRGNSPSYIMEKSVPFLVSTLKYYANFPDLAEGKQKDLLISKLSDQTSLSCLGYVLGPAVAAGLKILLLSPIKLMNSLELIKMTGLRIGFPEDTITILPDTVDVNTIMKFGSTLTVFGKQPTGVDKKKILSISPNSMPVIVFDNADLDSACHFITDVSWNNDILFHNCGKEVFVQETIYKQFVKKLKGRIENDTYKHSDEIQEKLVIKIAQAMKDGIEVFPKQNSSLGKILLIGGRIEGGISDCPCITVVPFRNVNEAIALANNNVQGLCASVWTENIGLANQVSQKLEVSNVWINSIGTYSPEVGFTPRKLSGMGYFGGIQGFNELRYENCVIESGKIESILQEKLLVTAANSAKKYFGTWGSMSRSDRIKVLGGIINYINENIGEFKSKMVTEEWLKDWKKKFLGYIESSWGFSITSPVKGFDLSVTYGSRGVLVAETCKNLEEHNKSLVISGVLEGNCLIILSACKEIEDFYKRISNKLPVGLLTILPFSKNACRFAVNLPEVDSYFFEYYVDDASGKYHKITSVTDSFSDVFSKVTYVKNVWSNIGQGS